MKKIITVIIVLFIAVFVVFQYGSTWLLYILTYTTGKGSHIPIPKASTNLNPPYKDGTFTGNSQDAFYGNIQVKAIISGGKISDVQFLQSPNSAARSLAINTLAMPELKQEAIQAQNGNVDVVSGATDTSNAFIQSLTSALTQAK